MAERVKVAPGRRAATARPMAEALEEGLARLRGRAVRVPGGRREPLSSRSRFRPEPVHVRLDRGPPLRVFFKDLHPLHLTTKARAVRELDLEPSYRELQMYQSVLDPDQWWTLHPYPFPSRTAAGPCCTTISTCPGGRLPPGGRLGFTPPRASCPPPG